MDGLKLLAWFSNIFLCSCLSVASRVRYSSFAVWYHTPFPPAVSSEVPLAGQSCGRRVRPALLSASRRKEVW